MRKIAFIFIIFCLMQPLRVPAAETPYRKIAEERAGKITASLDIANPGKSRKVSKLIAGQYESLNELHTTRDQALAGAADAVTKAKITSETAGQVKKLHARFIASLSRHLSAPDVVRVKDGMTYNVVPLTYRNYLLMLPYLSGAQQERVMSLLVEARELAMDEGTSKDKHAWFNKYKGKITIYLTKEGYNLKQEGADWAARRDTLSAALGNTKASSLMKSGAFVTDSRVEVRNLVIHQYQRLEAIKKERDVANAAISKDSSAAYRTQRAEAHWQTYKAAVDAQRDRFVAALRPFVDDRQMNLIKDEMTGFKMQKEYDKFMALLPGLTDPQKQQVRTYLLEARDNAMNDFTSREHNAWFAKYRGRTNNYLSREGYDLRKATEALEQKQ
jgi:hypothetical protein